jgi:type IV pilus assembly protein PilB
MTSPPPISSDDRRAAMVQRAADTYGVTDVALRSALLAVPREAFLPPELAELAYEDRHLPLPEGRTLPPADVVAAMIDALGLRPSDRVLEMGTGSGYAAALMSRLAAEVYTTDRRAALAAVARERLAALGCANVRVRHAVGDPGWAEQGPFDAVLVSMSVASAPKALLDQLAVGGRLVMPVGPYRPTQAIVRVTRTGPQTWSEEQVGEIRFVCRLGDILVDLGAASRDQVESAAKEETGRRIGERLLAEGRVEEADLYRALALQRGVRFGRVEELLSRIDTEIVSRIPRTYLERHRMVPLAAAGGVLVTATSDPDASIAELAAVFQPQRMEIYLVTPTDYRRLWSAIDLKLRARQAIVTAPGLTIQPAEDEALDLIAASGGGPDAKCVALFDALLLEAVGERASDIHLERYGTRVRVRLRIDGELRDQPGFQLSPADLIGLVNVIKIKGNLDIAERRLPQGGRIGLRAAGSTYDLRIQTQPALYGEHVVIRLLPQDTKLLTIEDLGFSPDIATQYRRLLDSPAGLVLVVGPTGSGKSTTLYAGLQVLARDTTRKVITIEDPIEYSLEGIQQAQVRPEIGFAFQHAMRAFVREDPDVILVGEIRDGETALEAIRASQTGHLVLSTLHCNDAVDAVQRLFDLGMHENSIASELLAIVAQRLTRRICEGCRVPAGPEPEILREVFPDGTPEGFRAFRGRGCPRCEGHGTRGRVAAIEYLRAGPEVRRAISRRLPVDELRGVALAAGLVTMRDNALRLVESGVIPLGELPRILPQERMAPERAAGGERPGRGKVVLPSGR